MPAACLLLRSLRREEVIAVLVPAVGCLVGLRGTAQEVGSRTDGVHPFADDILDLAQYLQAQGQPGVHAKGRCAAGVTGVNQQLGLASLGVYRVLAQSAL